MDLKSIVKSPDTTFVDVREPFEFDEGHVEGAINIPLREVMAKVDEIKSMNRPIVLYCAAGGRSGQALAFLQAKGLKDLHNGGGFTDVEALKAE